MLKTFWNDPVWSKVISAGILAAIGVGGIYLLNWWPIIGEYATSTFSMATARSSAPNWVVGFVGLMAIPTLLFVITAGWQIVNPTPADQPSWRDYRSDEFYGIRWQWQYFGTSMSEMLTFCPQCDFQVYPEHASAYASIERISFRCESCPCELGTFDESFGSLEDKAKRFAQQKIRTGKWRTAQKD